MNFGNIAFCFHDLSTQFGSFHREKWRTDFDAFYNNVEPSLTLYASAQQGTIPHTPTSILALRQNKMNPNLATWELIALGALALVVIFLFVPGLKRINEESKNAEKDWSGVLLPIAGVVVFVVLLILIV